MFKIRIDTNDIHSDMPMDTNLGLLEACDRAEIYKRKNPAAFFTVVNEDNGDVEYQI